MSHLMRHSIRINWLIVNIYCEFYEWDPTNLLLTHCSLSTTSCIIITTIRWLHTWNFYFRPAIIIINMLIVCLSWVWVVADCVCMCVCVYMQIFLTVVAAVVAVACPSARFLKCTHRHTHIYLHYHFYSQLIHGIVKPVLTSLS